MATDISQTHGSLTALCTTFIALTTIATGLRFYARVHRSQPLKSDDWILIPTWLGFIGTSAIVFWALDKHLIGEPSPDAKQELLDELKPQADLSITFDILSTVAFGLVKISALLFYGRVFCASGRHTSFQIYLNILIGFICAWLITFIILPGLQCSGHLDALWSANPADKRNYCKISANYLLSQAITDLALETVVLFTPAYQIYSLHTTASRRLGIGLVFLVGFASLAACIARLVFYVQLSNASKQNRITDHNLAYTTLAWFSVLESGIALVAVNLPALYWLSKYGSSEKAVASARSIFSLRSFASRVPGQQLRVRREVVTSDASLKSGEWARQADVETGLHDHKGPYDAGIGVQIGRVKLPLPAHVVDATRATLNNPAL